MGKSSKNNIPLAGCILPNNHVLKNIYLLTFNFICCHQKNKCFFMLTICFIKKTFAKKVMVWKNNKLNLLTSC